MPWSGFIGEEKVSGSFSSLIPTNCSSTVIVALDLSRLELVEILGKEIVQTDFFQNCRDQLSLSRLFEPKTSALPRLFWRFHAVDDMQRSLFFGCLGALGRKN